jgi:hypothetical protein
MTCEAFLGHLFLARDVTHSVHLNTRSYAKHKALNKFYVGIIDLADDFAEAYQGRIGFDWPDCFAIGHQTNNVVEFLEDSLKKVEEMRYKVVEKEDAALQNLIDSIVVLYLSTLYKLKFLA